MVSILLKLRIEKEIFTQNENMAGRQIRSTNGFHTAVDEFVN